MNQNFSATVIFFLTTFNKDLEVVCEQIINDQLHTGFYRYWYARTNNANCRLRLAPVQSIKGTSSYYRFYQPTRLHRVI